MTPFLNGALGNDTIFGGPGDDYIVGDLGNDIINGELGNDLMVGGFDNDTLTGGGGTDTFQFHKNDGVDTIMDFVAGNASNSIIQLLGYGISSFAQLQASLSQQGTDTLISLNGGFDRITLHDVTMTDLNAGDFLFS